MNHQKRLNISMLRVGMRVKRVEGDGENEKDVGREGFVKPNSDYNGLAGTFTVEYVATRKHPEPKIDGGCTPYEFVAVDETAATIWSAHKPSPRILVTSKGMP